MLEFKRLELDDMEIIRPYFEYGAKICDNTPATQMMWREIFKTEYAIAFKTALFRRFCGIFNASWRKCGESTP